MIPVLYHIKNWICKNEVYNIVGYMKFWWWKHAIVISGLAIRLGPLDGQVISMIDFHHWDPKYTSWSLHVEFVMNESESGVVFSQDYPIFPCYEFHSTTFFIVASCISFNFICPGMLYQSGHSCIAQTYNCQGFTSFHLWSSIWPDMRVGLDHAQTQ